MQPINLQKFDGPLSLKDPPELEWPAANDSREKEEALDANENVDEGLSWFYG